MHFEQWNCEWWNVVMCGIGACGNESWSNSLGNTVWAVLWYWVTVGKVSQRLIVGRGHTGHDLGSHEGFALYVPSHMRPFLFGYQISLCSIFALKEVGVMNFGHIWKCVWQHLTFLHSYWTKELWVVEWGHKWHWCLWEWNFAQVIKGHCTSNFLFVLGWGVILWKIQWRVDGRHW